MQKKTLPLVKVIALLIVVLLIMFTCIRWIGGDSTGILAGSAEGSAGESVGQYAGQENGEVYVAYPEYTEESVADGHFTGGFDLRMVLLGFRDKLDRGDYGVDIGLNKEADFVLWQDAASRDIHAVMESKDGQQYVIVTAGDAGIDRFPTLRQVHSFRIIAAEELDSFTDSWTLYGASAGSKKGAGLPESEVNSSVIRAEEGELLLYHVNDKDNRISLEEDQMLVESILEAVSLTQNITADEPMQYVVKAEGCKYMFDWSGKGIKDLHDDGTVLLEFCLSGDEMDLLKEVCVKYGIYEE